MPLNESQKLCATGFGASLAVIAGAGSGKTFTLKERIANAFDPEIVDGRMEPVTSIEQVMAITFTDRAALELKGRVRSTLKQRGLTEQALLVDTAWISTIHGMCSRILRENALELGIDPAFEVVADERRTALLDEAMEYVFKANEGCATSVTKLFEEYSPNTLKDMISKLVELAARSTDGFDAIEGPVSSPEERQAEKALFDVVSSYLSVDAEGPVTATPADVADFINDNGPFGEHTLSDGTTLTWDAPWGTEEKPTSAARKNRVANELRLLAASRLWEPLMNVAKATEAKFAGLKRERGVLDNNDLLSLTARALEREDIRARYADRFRLVMVDEFQDTDQTQLDIIRVLSGPNCERLCVVGDPQQSIYRFRGADLSVCEGHLATIPAEPDRQIHLDTNYRSHPDILDFVDVVFGAPRGTDADAAADTGFYQRLVPGRSEERVPKDKRLMPAEGPRVEVIDIEHHTYGIRQARSLAAAHIARRFKDIHEATGRPWSHMVILLGKMTNAQTYANALDELGIPCAITGGSVLAKRADAQVMLALVRVLANVYDDTALVSLLTSDLFGLTPDDLLQVRTLTGTRRLGVGFARLMDNVSSGRDPLPEEGTRLAHALAVITRAVARAGQFDVARTMKLLLVESGWLARMEAKASVTATSRAADAFKVIRMVEDIEAQGAPGARSVAEALAARLDAAKESPGVLQAERADFVRIMTIHASKGLQFPIVATAELEPGAAHSTKLTTETSRGTTFVSLDLEHTLKGTAGRLSNSFSEERKKIVANLEDEAHVEAPLDDNAFSRLLAGAAAGDLSARDALIRAYGSDQGDLELERKIYVSLTRAEEALIVCFFSAAKSDRVTGRLKSLPNDELGISRAMTVSTSKSKKYTQEEKDEAKALVTLVKTHMCLPFVGVPEGIPARIRARRATIEAAGYTYLHAPAAYTKCWELTGKLPPNWVGEDNIEGTLVEFEDVTSADELEAIESVAELPVALELPRAAALRYKAQGGLGMLSASALHHASDAPNYEAPVQVSFSDDREPEASATERGSAFHLMGEVAALRWKPGCALELPEDRLAPTARLYGLSARQEEQLGREMGVWLASDVARDMAAHAFLEPEAPFSVELPKVEGAAALVLTGFIDLLAYNERGSGVARVVDYKTGTFLDTDEKRRKAYEVQARCYAYALMCQGFSEVTLEFVFVDQPTEDGMPALCSFPAPGEPAWTPAELEEFLSREVSRMLSL